jgi:hypothetical protein
MTTQQQRQPDIMDPSIAEMRPRLLTLDQAREKLSRTEPLDELKFEAAKEVRFTLPENWDVVAEELDGTDDTGASATLLSGQKYRLTKDALLEAGAKVGIPRKLQMRTPAKLLEPWLNWWFQGNGGWEGKSFKSFVSGADGPDQWPLVIAFGSGSISPFSNLGILDRLVASIRRFYKADEQDLLVDYKFVHSLELTQARVVVPGFVRNITGPGTAEPSDLWSTGVQWQNSQLGLKPTSVDGYLFRWRCTNGMTDTLVTSGKFNRRDGSGSDVYDWAGEAVDEVLGGLEHALGGVQDATTIPVEQDVSLVLDDLFRQHKVPGKLQAEIIRNMAEVGGELSMYTLLNAITLAANDPDLSPGSVVKLQQVGGHVAHSAEMRCVSCRRIKPE